MRKALDVLLLAAVAACGNTGRFEPTSPLRDFTTFNGGRIELAVSGGFAALEQSDVVTHDDRRFTHVLRRMCAPSACGVVIDSVSGSMGGAASDSLFNIALANVAGLRDDYGTSHVAADAAAYRLTVSNITGTKTVTADDVTMPPPMRAIVEALTATIAAARK